MSRRVALCVDRGRDGTRRDATGRDGTRDVTGRDRTRRQRRRRRRALINPLRGWGRGQVDEWRRRGQPATDCGGGMTRRSHGRPRDAMVGPTCRLGMRREPLASKGGGGALGRGDHALLTAGARSTTDPTRETTGSDDREDDGRRRGRRGAGRGCGRRRRKLGGWQAIVGKPLFRDFFLLLFGLVTFRRLHATFFLDILG